MSPEHKSDDYNWRDEATCKGKDPDLFYPPTEDEADAAKDICRQCGVRIVCLEFALQTHQEDGVWGGTTNRDRRRIARNRRRRL